jgi:aminoglycoside 6'-N-acetyltransferase I
MDAMTVDAAAMLAQKLWPEAQTLTGEFSAALENPEFSVFLAYEQDTPIGFAQCQLRHDYVEGCETSPVGYLEGLFVAEAFRGTGVAKALLARCEAWARECGCAEFASDCELTNTQSIAFHKKVGFAEENRIVCFKKEL